MDKTEAPCGWDEGTPEPTTIPMEMEMTDRNIHQRLADVMKNVSYIQKDTPQGLQYAIVSHDVVTKKVRPALLEQGIVYYPQNMKVSQSGNRTEMTLDVKFVNIDNPDDFILVPSCGYGIDSQDKGPGKAESYAVKFALLKALGLETGLDPDLDQTVEHEASDPRFISAEQVAELNNLADEVEADKPGFCKYMKVASLADIQSSAFGTAKAALEKKRTLKAAA